METPHAENEPIALELIPLLELGGGNPQFVRVLLGKMQKGLVENMGRMQQALAKGDWAELKAASHKAKSTFAYLGLMDIRAEYQLVEHHSVEDVRPDLLPDLVKKAIASGNKVLDALARAVETLP